MKKKEKRKQEKEGNESNLSRSRHPLLGRLLASFDGAAASDGLRGPDRTMQPVYL
jgi:hypothetical protein